MKMQVKFKIIEITEFEYGFYKKTETGTQVWEPAPANRIKFQVVNGDKPENEVFANYTPYGTMEFCITNQALVGTFKVGEELFFDIHKA